MRKATIFAGKKTASKKVVRKKAVKQPKATPKTQASGRSSYWAVYPRNFANEYTLYKVSAGEKNKFTEWSEDYINDPNADVQRRKLVKCPKRLTRRVATNTEILGSLERTKTR